MQYKIRLQPIVKAVRAEAGTPLRELLFEQGVEFPCGGNGQCRGCRVRVLEGDAAVTAAETARLSAEEIGQGWRLACQRRLEGDLTIELRQWDAAILADDSHFSFTPQEGLGIAVDIGTTTLVSQLLDLSTGHVLAVKTAFNPQARHGADVMSRVQFAVADGGQPELERLIRAEVGRQARLLLHSAAKDPARLRRVALVGNTVMHHLFCGIDLEPLSHCPFEPVNDGLQVLETHCLGWEGVGSPRVEFLPCLGSFVGSDVSAGALAMGLHRRDEPAMLIDLGTNGEIVIGNRERLLCASTAAGPAFEGARIHAGMRASSGAIWKVEARDGRMVCHTIGNTEARGICGSGLVDAVAAGLQLGMILPGGRIAGGNKQIDLTEGVCLSQADIRQLQLAKGAIAAGIRMLREKWGDANSVTNVYLSGAFGNYVDRESARRIGLFDFPPEDVEPCGNTALLGAKLALFDSANAVAELEMLKSRSAHHSLNEEERFMDVYVQEMSFPASRGGD